jgi:hypothetical protein
MADGTFASRTLLPGYAAYGDAHHPLVLGGLGDHVAIRQRSDQLAADPTVSPQALHDLGERLASHVRLEERELSPDRAGHPRARTDDARRETPTRRDRQP